jgi:hypothetical protein
MHGPRSTDCGTDAEFPQRTVPEYPEIYTIPSQGNNRLGPCRTHGKLVQDISRWKALGEDPEIRWTENYSDIQDKNPARVLANKTKILLEC